MSKFRGLSKVVLALVLGFTFAGVSIADEDKGIGVPEPCPVCTPNVMDVQCPWLNKQDAEIKRLEKQATDINKKLDAAKTARNFGEFKCNEYKKSFKKLADDYSTMNNENTSTNNETGSLNATNKTGE